MLLRNQLQKIVQMVLQSLYTAQFKIITSKLFTFTICIIMLLCTKKHIGWSHTHNRKHLMYNLLHLVHLSQKHNQRIPSFPSVIWLTEIRHRFLLTDSTL